jgi:hypothetical protein
MGTLSGNWEGFCFAEPIPSAVVFKTLGLSYLLPPASAAHNTGLKLN